MKRNEVNQMMLALGLAIVLCAMSTSSITSTFKAMCIIVGLVLSIVSILNLLKKWKQESSPE